jgi:two-component system chemotaxis response regulator CheY
MDTPNWVSLPTASPAAPSPPATQGTREPPAADKVRVLIVDDMPSMRAVMGGILRNLGFAKISEADSGTAAIRRLDAGGIDLVITDWNMPGMTGVELIETIRRSELYGKVPILMVSAEAKRPNILEAAQNGVDGFIVKPFTPSVLSEKLAFILYRKRAVVEQTWAGQPTGATHLDALAAAAAAAADAPASDPTRPDEASANRFKLASI